jgi:hypothetical protein
MITTFIILGLFTLAGLQTDMHGNNNNYPGVKK